MSFDPDGQQSTGPGGLTVAYNALNQTSSINQTPHSYYGTGQDPSRAIGTTILDTSIIGIVGRTDNTGDSYYSRTDDGTIIDERLPGGSKYYYMLDGLGSVIGLTNTSGAVANTYSYDPYGDQTAATGTAPNVFGYAGGYKDDSSNLIHFGQRYYNPTHARWTQMDPVGPLSQDYTYVGDNPIDNVDPTGESQGPNYCLHISQARCQRRYYYNLTHPIKNPPLSKLGRCFLGALGGVAVSFIPGVDVGAAEAAIAGCGAATGDPSQEVTGHKK